MGIAKAIPTSIPFSRHILADGKIKQLAAINQSIKLFRKPISVESFCLPDCMPAYLPTYLLSFYLIAENVSVYG